MLEEIYTSGEYLAKNPTWHIEDSSWKAMQIIRMIAQNHLAPKTICEVGCGAGEIQKQLQEVMDNQCMFCGYDISPQAIELCKVRSNARLQFKLADIKQEQGVFFDLLLVIDVLEHLEDYFNFLREIRAKGQYKIFHFPLDLSMNMVVSGRLMKIREAHGHIHYFTKDTALQTLKDVSYEVVDYFYTSASIEVPSQEFKSEIKRRLLKLPRKLFFGIHRDLAARILGGWSLLVLAK